MKFKDLLKAEQTAKENYLKLIADKNIEVFVRDASSQKNHSGVVIELKRRLEAFDKQWSEDVTKRVIHGRRSKRILAQSVPHYRIEDFIKKQFNFIINHKKSSFTMMSYTKEKFIELSKIEVAMLLFKYGGDLMEFEVKIAIAELLLRYFELYVGVVDMLLGEKQQWCFQPADIYSCFEILLNMDYADYKKYFNYFTTNFTFVKHNRSFEIEYKKRIKPECEEDLAALYKEGMSQAQFDNAIAAYYEVSPRTARTWRREYGKTRMYSRNDASQNIISISKDEILQLQQQISEKDSAINTLEVEKKELEKQNKWLKEENRNLLENSKYNKNEIDRLNRVIVGLREENNRLKPNKA